jgi:hypothetical protein
VTTILWNFSWWRRRACRLEGHLHGLWEDCGTACQFTTCLRCGKEVHRVNSELLARQMARAESLLQCPVARA